MADTYTSSLRVRLQANGANDSLWGSYLNTGALQLLEDSIAGRAAVTHDDTANYSLTTANGSADEARRMILNIGGALTAARNVVVPTQSKVYIVKNATTGGFAVTVKTTAGTGISVPNGKTMLLFCDGTNVVHGIDALGDLAVANITASGTLGVTGTTTLGDALIGAVSQDVFNTVSTTVNAFGAASAALNIGHPSVAAAFLGGISVPTGKNVTGAGTAQVTGFSTVSATTLTGTLSTAAQTNITSVGILTSAEIAGRLVLGTSADVVDFLAIGFLASSNNGIGLRDSGDVADAGFVRFRKASGTSIGSITRNSTTDAVLYNTSSDAELKNIIGDSDLIAADKRVMAYRMRDFEWKSKPGSIYSGPIAQEIYSVNKTTSLVAPGRVVHGEKVPWGINMSGFIPDLIMALQLLRADVNGLLQK